MTCAQRSARLHANGFSITELLVAMILLSIVMIGLIPLSAKVSKMSTQSTAVTQRAAGLGGEVQRLEAEPYDSLKAGTFCANFATPGFPHTNCVTVTVVNSKTKRLKVVVTPTSGILGADSTTIERSEPSSGNPLNLP